MITGLTRPLLEGAALGLSTGGYCLAGCVPFLLPFFLSEERRWARDLRLMGEFLAGRLVAYLLFGALFGWLGEYARDLVSPRVVGVLLLVTSAMLIAFGIARSFPSAGLCAAVARSRLLGRFPFVVGFLLGLNVCPPFLVGVSALVALGTVGRALAFSTGFFLTTTLFLLPVAAAARLSRFPSLRDVAQAASVLTGLYFLVRGFVLLI
ncbi:MAG: sulfite exporter TauE/SafE family protein [Candidatus Coatesbacteria bacterium]